uniref:Cysteine-rich and transmembrane domain-containing protein WIH2-like n=1 Tax=Cicer arietinum TaxID=3827 RepID=A0A1S3E9E4_CICAR|nr:cysteine-rich and transmembrane domain-containing protein WIH2-like [Cicer arietinum]
MAYYNQNPPSVNVNVSAPPPAQGYPQPGYQPSYQGYPPPQPQPQVFVTQAPPPAPAAPAAEAGLMGCLAGLCCCCCLEETCLLCL